MTSNVAKGGAFQRWVKAWVESNYPGSIVHNEAGCANSYYDKKEDKIVYRSKNRDIFNCIDLIAVIPGKKTIFIQATLHKATGYRLKEFVVVPWNLDHCIVQLWQDKGGGRKVIQQLSQHIEGGCVVSSLTTVGEIIRGKCDTEIFD